MPPVAITQHPALRTATHNRVALDIVKPGSSAVCKLQNAELTHAQLAALRLYTTSAFKYLNGPLRDQDRFNNQRPHHFPVTVKLIAEAAGQLKAISSSAADAAQPRVLYRGLRNVAPPDDRMDGWTAR